MSVDQVLNVYFPTNKSHEITCETECIMRDSKKIKTRILVAIIIYRNSKVDDSVLMVNTVVLNYFQSSACVSVRFVLNFPWTDSYASNNSREFKLLNFGMAIVVSSSVIYNESCIISRSHIDPTRASKVINIFHAIICCRK